MPSLMLLLVLNLQNVRLVRVQVNGILGALRPLQRGYALLMLRWHQRSHVRLRCIPLQLVDLSICSNRRPPATDLCSQLQ